MNAPDTFDPSTTALIVIDMQRDFVLPGGFAFGDYLRTGAMAAHSPVMRHVVAKANAGTPVIGICT